MNINNNNNNNNNNNRCNRLLTDKRLLLAKKVNNIMIAICNQNTKISKCFKFHLRQPHTDTITHSHEGKDKRMRYTQIVGTHIWLKRTLKKYDNDFFFERIESQEETQRYTRYAKCANGLHRLNVQSRNGFLLLQIRTWFSYVRYAIWRQQSCVFNDHVLWSDLSGFSNRLTSEKVWLDTSCADHFLHIQHSNCKDSSKPDTLEH